MSSLGKRQTRGIRRNLSQEERQVDDDFYKRCFGDTDLDDDANFSESSEYSQEQQQQSPEDPELMNLLNQQNSPDKSNLGSRNMVQPLQGQKQQQIQEQTNIDQVKEPSNIQSQKQSQEKQSQEQLSQNALKTEITQKQHNNSQKSKDNDQNSEENHNHHELEDEDEEDLDVEEEEMSEKDCVSSDIEPINPVKNGYQLRKQSEVIVLDDSESQQENQNQNQNQQENNLQTQQISYEQHQKEKMLQQQRDIMRAQGYSEAQIKVEMGKRLINENSQQYPYVRGIHYLKKIDEVERYDFSYIKYQEPYTFQGKSEVLNRELYQVPLKCAKNSPDLEKTDYQMTLFQVEDERWQIDTEIQQLLTAMRQTEKMESKCNTENYKTSRYYNYINQMKLFGTFGILINSQWEHIQNLKDKIIQRLDTLKNMRQEKQNKWNNSDLQVYHASLDQKFFYEKQNAKSMLTIRDFIKELMERQKEVDIINNNQPQNTENGNNSRKFFQIKNKLLKHKFFSQEQTYFPKQVELDQGFNKEENQVILESLSKQYEQIFNQQQNFNNNNKVQVPGYIYEFSDRKNLEFSIQTMVSYINLNIQAQTYGRKNQILNVLKVFSEDLFKVEFLKDQDNGYQEKYEQKIMVFRDNLPVLQEFLSKNIDKNKVEFNPEKLIQSLKEKYQNQQVISDSSSSQEGQQQQLESQYLQPSQFFPRVQNGNIMYGSAFLFVTLSYIQKFYEQINLIYSSLKEQNLSDIELQINEIYREKEVESYINLEEFVQNLIIQIKDQTIDDVVFEEVVKCFGPLRKAFLGLKFLLQQFKKSVDYFANDLICQQLTFSCKYSEVEQYQQFQKNIRNIYEKHEANKQLGTLMCRIMFDSEQNMLYIHQFPIRKFNFLQVIDLENSELDEEDYEEEEEEDEIFDDEEDDEDKSQFTSDIQEQKQEQQQQQQQQKVIEVISSSEEEDSEEEDDSEENLDDEEEGDEEDEEGIYEMPKNNNSNNILDLRDQLRNNIISNNARLNNNEEELQQLQRKSWQEEDLFSEDNNRNNNLLDQNSPDVQEIFENNHQLNIHNSDNKQLQHDDILVSVDDEDDDSEELSSQVSYQNNDQGNDNDNESDCQEIIKKKIKMQ